MEININNRMINKFKMKNIFSLMFIFLIMVSSGFSITQNEIINYQFEENGGSVYIDSSGNDFHASITGAKWKTVHKWGDYSSYYDGSTDYATTQHTQQIPDVISFSLWINEKSTADDIVFNIYSTDDLLQLWIDTDSSTNENLYLKYKDTNQNLQLLTLDNNSFNTNQWYHIVLNFDLINNTITYYRDNHFINIYQLNPVSRQTDSYLRLGADVDGTKNELNGYIDSFRVFDFLLNSSQINSLYSSNTITLIKDNNSNNDENITQTTQTQIINYTLPENDYGFNGVGNIEVGLNHKADCDLYINNSLIKNYTNILGFVYSLENYENGEYKYFVYCEYTENQTLNFQLTKNKKFTLSKPKKTIEFTIYDKNNNLANIDNLYLITPCPKEEEFNKYYIDTDNKEYYIQSLINGKSSFNLSYNGEYNFCLVNGKINYKINDYSNQYDFISDDKIINLGKLFVNNETLNYNIKVNDEDLYKPTNPHFWGQNWSALFQLIVGIFIGGFLILIGLGTNMDKLVIVGGLIIAIGMGLSISTIVGVVV